MFNLHHQATSKVKDVIGFWYYHVGQNNSFIRMCNVQSIPNDCIGDISVYSY